MAESAHTASRFCSESHSDRQIPATTGKLFQRVLRVYQQRRADEARAVCEAILNADSKHSDAWHLLGLIAAQAADYERAVELMSRAIELDPDNAALYSNRGAALQMLSQPEAALAS